MDSVFDGDKQPLKGALCAILLYLESPNCPIIRFVYVLNPSYVNNEPR